MTPRQRYAVDHPVLPSARGIEPRLWRYNEGLGAVSAIAVLRSAATFGGRPAWHAACARVLNGVPVVLDEYTGRDRRVVVSLAEHVLDGVGVPGFDAWEHTERMYHLRRPLSDLEMELLPPGWIDLPPASLR